MTFIKMMRTLGDIEKARIVYFFRYWIQNNCFWNMMNFMWYWWSILSISSYIHPIIGITQVLGPPADSSHLKCGSDRGFEPGNGRKEWWWWGMDGGFLEFQDVSNFQQHSIKPLCVENRVFDITTRNMEVPTYNLYFSWLRQPMVYIYIHYIVYIIFKYNMHISYIYTYKWYSPCPPTLPLHTENQDTCWVLPKHWFTVDIEG